MRFVLERVANPEIEPVTLAEMKRHLRAYAGTSEGDDITALIVSSREWVEDFTGRALVDQTWRLTVGQPGIMVGDAVGGYPERAGYYCGRYQRSRVGKLLLRKAPVLAIVSVSSVDATGAETLVDAANYQLREEASKWPCIVPLNGASWSMSTFRIVFRAGFADQTSSPQTGAEVVPERFKQAMKLWAEAMYDRDPVQMPQLLKAAHDLIRPERVELGFA